MVILFLLVCLIYVVILYIQFITLSGPFKHLRITNKNKIENEQFEFDDEELIEWAKDNNLV